MSAHETASDSASAGPVEMGYTELPFPPVTKQHTCCQQQADEVAAYLLALPEMVMQKRRSFPVPVDVHCHFHANLAQLRLGLVRCMIASGARLEW